MGLHEEFNEAVVGCHSCCAAAHACTYRAAFFVSAGLPAMLAHTAATRVLTVLWYRRRYKRSYGTSFAVTFVK